MAVDERRKVLEGRDGFLFLVNDTNELLEQHAGRRQLTHVQLEQWRMLLERRIERVAAVGGRYVFAVAPDTPAVYPEMLPTGCDVAARRPVHQLIEHLESCGSPARVLYPVEELIAQKGEQLLCERVGTHWTDFGAFIAYRFVMDALGDEVAARALTKRDIYYMDGTVDADLGNKVDPPRIEQARLARVVHHAAHPVYDNCIFSTGSIIVTRCDVAPPTRCMVFGDSYMYALLKFFPDTFRRVVFAHRPTIPDALLESERPDLVISVMAERALVRIPVDDAGPEQRETEGQKRGAGRLRGPFAPHGNRPNLATVAQVEEIRGRMLASGELCDATIISLLAYAGLDARDVLSLRWCDVREDCIQVPPRAVAEPARRVPLWPAVADDLRRWRDARTADNEDHVIYDGEGSWGVGDWEEWRVQRYTPAVREIGLTRLPPWGLHNTYVHLRLIEGATPAEVAAETGAPVHDYAVARAQVAASAGAAERSGEAVIRVSRAAVDTPGTEPAVS